MFYDAKKKKLQDSFHYSVVILFSVVLFLFLVLTACLESLLICNQASWVFLSRVRPESSNTEAKCVSLNARNVCLSK